MVDSLDARIDARSSRKALVQDSEETLENYKDSGIKIKAGQGAATMMDAGAAAYAAGGIVLAAGAGSSGACAVSGGVAAASVGLVLAAPARVIGGIVRAVDNSAVNEEIGLWQSQLPIELLAGADSSPQVIFFPLAPSPKTVEITCTDAEGARILDLDLRTALKGLYMDEQETKPAS